MPTAVGPNTFGEENLVFGYDLGDTGTSYKGEPVTNLITSGLPGYFGSGGQTLYQNKLYGLKSDSGVFQRNYVTNPALADSGTYNNNGGLYKTFATSNLNASTRYIRICFDFYMITRYRTYSGSGTGLNGYIGITNADSTTDAYGWNTTYCNGSGDDWSNKEAYVGKWQKVTLIAELREDKNPASINAMYIYYDRFTQGEGIFTNFIITEHATFPSGPVRYTAGTRSATQGLQDLTGNSTIDLSNVSFDSNAQMIFDGTNDSLVVGNNTVLKNNNTSIEFIIKYINTPNGDIIQFGVGSGDYAQYYYRAYSGNSYWNFYPAGGDGVGDITIPNAVLPLNQYHHIVMTGDAQGYVQFYINGVAQSGANRSSYSQAANWTPASLTVGGFSWDGYSNSEIPYVKIYNKVLTASEIQQNFNAIKGRFNI